MGPMDRSPRTSMESTPCGAHVSFETDPGSPGGTGTVRLHRPPMNAIDAAVRDGVRAAVGLARSSGVGRSGGGR